MDGGTNSGNSDSRIRIKKMWNLKKAHKVSEMLASIAVILSLLFVGYEVQQNNLVQKQEATRDTVRDWSYALASFEAPGMACLNHRLFTEPETLTLEEASQIENIYVRLFKVQEELHYQHTQGMIDESVYEGFRNTLKWYAANQGFRNWFSTYRNTFSPRFQGLIDEVVKETVLVTDSYYMSLKCDSVVGEEYWQYKSG
jgi:hypothetical protein